MTIKDYYKKFGSLWGVSAGAIASLPLLHYTLPLRESLVAFPPLGDMAVVVSIVLGLLATMVVYYVQYLSFVKSARVRMLALLGAFAITVVGALFLFFVNTRLVRVVAVPSEETSRAFVIGFERTQFVPEGVLPSPTDEELIRRTVVSEEGISKLWTAQSIATAKVLVLVCYLVFYIFAVSTFSMGVLFQGCGVPTEA